MEKSGCTGAIHMATVQEPVKAPHNRHERFVQQQLSQATNRVRFLDFATAALGLMIAGLTYGLLMIFVDRWLHLSQLTRQLGLAAFGVVAAVYAWFIMFQPF